MSAEAYAFVWENGVASGLRGNHLLTVLVMAGASKDRRAPFITEVSAEDIAKKIGVTVRYVRKIIAELIESGHIRLVQKGSGQLPNMYTFGRLGVNWGSLQGVNPSSRVNEASTEVA